jgi:hypothetical protein
MGKDYIYVDASLYNSNITPWLNADFALTSTSTILDDSVEYDMAVVKFNIDASEIPLYQVAMDTTAGNVNTLIYTVTLTNGANSSTVAVTWIPEFVGEAVPTNTVLQDTSTKYYWGATYNHLLQLFNTALAQALSTLPGAPVGADAPYFVINYDTLKIQLVAQCAYYDTTAGNIPDADRIYIYINQEAHSLFKYFPGIINNFVKDDDYFRFDVTNTGTNCLYPAPAVPIRPPDYAGGTSSTYVMTQEKSSLASWNIMTQLVLLNDGTLPFSAETTTAPLKFNTPVSSNITSNSTRQANEFIVTDFDVDPDLRVTSGGDRIIYNANPYRLISLHKHAPINSIRLRFQWRDTYGNLHPLQLARNTSATIKLLFIPKTVNHADLIGVQDKLLVGLNNVQQETRQVHLKTA